MDQADSLAVIRFAPYAEIHCAEAQRADLHSGTAETAKLHAVEDTTSHGDCHFRT